MEILISINGVKTWIKLTQFYEFMCSLKRDTKLTVDNYMFSEIARYVPEFLPNILDESYFGTIAGIKILHD